MKLHSAAWVSNALILSGLLLLWSWVAQSLPSTQRLAIDALVLLGALLFVRFGLLQWRLEGRWPAAEPVMSRPLPRRPR